MSSALDESLLRVRFRYEIRAYMRPQRQLVDMPALQDPRSGVFSQPRWHLPSPWSVALRPPVLLPFSPCSRSMAHSGRRLVERSPCVRSPILVILPLPLRVSKRGCSALPSPAVLRISLLAALYAHSRAATAFNGRLPCPRIPATPLPPSPDASRVFRQVPTLSLLPAVLNPVSRA